MEKVTCYKCSDCEELYETEEEAVECEGYHTGYEQLQIVDAKHLFINPGTYEYGYPQHIRIEIKGKSGSMAQYSLKIQGAVEAFAAWRKPIGDC